MPSLPKRPCAGGCGALVERGRCAACAQKAERERGTANARGYDAAWRRLRVRCFERDGWRCVDCGWIPMLLRLFQLSGPKRPSREALLAELRTAKTRGDRWLEADHQIPIEVRPDLRLSLDNLRTRCNHCHAKKTAREDGGFDRVRVARPADASAANRAPAPEFSF